MSTTDTPTSRTLPRIAAASLILAGLAVAVYAIIAFNTPDWMIAGPGLLVVGAGIAGLRQRWLFLLGVAPIGAALTIARPILAYDLARPDETAYFLGTAFILVLGCMSAALGIAAIATSNRRMVPLASLGALVLIPLVTTFIATQSPSSETTDDQISAAQRADAVEVIMADYAFAVDPELLVGGQVLHLQNAGSFPHDFTIPSLDVAVIVPPGRDTYLQLPAQETGPTLLYCTVGDHRSRGMELQIPAPA